MLYKTRGIVFQTFNYTDNSFIAKIYTELFGLQSFLVNNPRGKISSTKINVFQRMNLVELVMYRKKKKQLHHIKEIRMEQPFFSTPFNHAKSSIVFFLNEILCKCIKEEESRPDSFLFIRNFLLELDQTEAKFANLHIYFLTRLAGYMGFMPGKNFSTLTPVFDLQAGIFKSEAVGACLSRDASEQFYFILINPSKKISNMKIHSSIRREILNGMLTYFKIHVHGFGEIKSLKVLEELFY